MIANIRDEARHETPTAGGLPQAGAGPTFAG